MSKQKKNANKEFKIASWAIDNPSVIFVMIAILLWVGFSAYQSMPREDYPEIIETNNSYLKQLHYSWNQLQLYH